MRTRRTSVEGAWEVPDSRAECGGMANLVDGTTSGEMGRPGIHPPQKPVAPKSLPSAHHATQCRSGRHGPWRTSAGGRQRVGVPRRCKGRAGTRRAQQEPAPSTSAARARRAKSPAVWRKQYASDEMTFQPWNYPETILHSQRAQNNDSGHLERRSPTVGSIAVGERFALPREPKGLACTARRGRRHRN